jgi:hypothetical protein
VARLLRRYGWGYAVQARIARELGVSQATVCRDLQAVWWRARSRAGKVPSV